VEPARRWLIAYDIGQDDRRGRVARLLEAHGDRVQYSVFVVDLRPARLVRLRVSLAALIADSDSLLVVDLGPIANLTDQRFSYLGRQRSITAPASFVT